MNNILKFSAFILFVMFMASCFKNEDPYAAYTPEREATIIKEWLATMTTNKKDIDTTSTGLFYIVEKIGTGPTVISGNTVKVKYTGIFLDGTVFDDSSYYGDGTMTYVHKTDRMVIGWEEGIEVLSKGGRAAFLVPSAKGYGVAGSGRIPRNTPLIFIIEVLDIQ